jgi:hypothetical protein
MKEASRVKLQRYPHATPLKAFLFVRQVYWGPLPQFSCLLWRLDCSALADKGGLAKLSAKDDDRRVHPLDKRPKVAYWTSDAWGHCICCLCLTGREVDGHAVP